MKAAVTGDLEHLQGTWDITSVKVDGRTLPPSGYVTVSGNRFASLGMGSPYEGTLTLVATTRPKRFDLRFTSGPEKGRRNLGIYTLAGERWTICLATRGSTRPTAFASAKKDGVVVETLERRSETTRPAPRSPSSDRAPQRRRDVSPEHPEPAEPAEPATILEGEWAMESASFNGDPMDESAVKWCRRITRGNLTRVVAGPQTFLDATFTLDDNRAPTTIDYVNIGGSNKGTSQKGVVDLRDGVLRICISAPGKPRPRNFSSTKGDGRSYTTWRLIRQSPDESPTTPRTP